MLLGLSVKKVIFVIWVVLTAFGSGARAGRYDSLMRSTAGRDTLRSLALWEDQRVTGDGELFAYLSSSDPLVRLRAVQVIGRIQDPADVEILVGMLSDADKRVVSETLFALGQIGADTASAALVGLSSKAKSEQLGLGVEALGKIGGKAAGEFLMETLHNFYAEVRGEAALALARAAETPTIPALLIAIHDPNTSVAWRAIYALEKNKSSRVGESILPFLSNSDPMVRQFTARTLGKQEYDKAVEQLGAALTDSDVRVVVNAALALGEMDDDDAVHPLGEHAATHKSHHARKAAMQSLGKIKSKKGKDYMIRALLDESAGVRIAAIKALAETLEGGAEVFITQLMSDGSRLARAAALECYGLADIKGQIGMLMEEAQRSNDPMMRAAAVTGLAELDDDRVGPFLVSMLADRDWVVATVTVTALGKQDYRQAASDLVALYGDRTRREEGNVRLEILRVFSDWKTPEATDVARSALRDPDWRIRDQAEEYLTEMGMDLGEVMSARAIYEENFDRRRLRSLSAPLGTRHAVIATKYGDIEIELFGDDAIQTVANFINLAREGFYNGLTFHRVEPNFVVQGGDPRGDGWGDAGYYVPSEYNRHRYETGYVGVPSDGKDIEGGQFFIMLSPAHRLDGNYTTFGKVTKGMDVVWKIDQGDTMEVRILD